MGRNIFMSRRRFFQLAGVAGGAAGALSLIGCGGSSSGETGSDGSDGGDATLTIAIADEPEGMDIQQIGWENVVHALLFEPLICYSPDLSQIQPCFAKEFSTSEDGLTYTFVLPDDAKFSNGDALDASIKRYLEISEYASDYDSVDSFEVVDDHTYAMHLKEPAPFMMASLCSSDGGVVDASIASSEDKDAFNRAPVANGAYYVDSWDQGSQVTLKRNENFHTNNPSLKNAGAPNIGTIVIRFIPDEFTRVSEVESGDADVIFDVPTSSVQEIKDNADLQAYDYEQAGASMFYLNTNDPILADDQVRAALTYAIDRDEIAAALDGLVTPLYGYISEAQSCYSDEEEKKLQSALAFDADKAKQLLADAGWADSDGDGIVEKDGQKLSIEMLVPSDRASLKNASPVIQQQLSAIGVDASIREYEAAYIKTQLKDDNYQMGARNYVWNDPDILYSTFTPESGYSWDDPEITDLLKKARTEPDPDARKQDYVDFQEAMATRYRAIALFADKYIIAAKASVSDLQVTTDGRLWVNDAEV